MLLATSANITAVTSRGVPNEPTVGYRLPPQSLPMGVVTTQSAPASTCGEVTQLRVRQSYFRRALNQAAIRARSVLGVELRPLD